MVPPGEIAKSKMAAVNQHPFFAAGQGLHELLIQVPELYLVVLRIFKINIFVIRVSADEAIPDVIHHLHGIGKIQPDMRILAAMTALVPMLFCYRVFRHNNPLTCIHNDEIRILRALQDFLNPGLHIFVRIDEDICPVEFHHVTRLWLETVRFDTRRKQQGHVHFIPADVAGKVIGRKQGGYDFEPVVFFYFFLILLAGERQTDDGQKKNQKNGFFQSQRIRKVSVAVHSHAPEFANCYILSCR